jgi:hypothetical protein
LEPNPEERLVEPCKVACAEAWRVDIDAGFDSGIHLARAAGCDEPGRMPDGSNSRHIQSAGKCLLGIRSVQFGDLADNKLEILGVIRHNFGWAVKLALARLRNFAAGERDSSHVRMIDSEHRVAMTGQILRN